MTKRKRAKNEFTELPQDNEGVSLAATSEEEAVVAEESLLPVGTSIHEGETFTAEEVAIAYVAAKEGLGPTGSGQLHDVVTSPAMTTGPNPRGDQTG